MLSKRIKNMKPSMTVQLTDKLEDLKRKGIDIISFNIGEPDFNTPDNVINAAKKALDQGFTKYTVVSGILELKEAICNKLKIDNNIVYEPSQIIVTAGAKQALTNALLTLCDPGDEVILLTPCWVSYIEMVKLADATPILVPTDEKNGFQLNFKGIEEAITDRTKAIIVNTPNNPTGALYSEADLKKLGELAIKHDFYIISDEIYEKLIYDDTNHVSMASLSDEIKEKTITINGFSKAYSMTGWRLGYAAGPKEIIKGMNALQGHMTSAVNSIAQKAAVEALLGPQESIENMRREYDERRRYLVERLNKIEGINCFEPKGAFYLFVDVSNFIGKQFNDKKMENSIDIAEFLLEEAHIAVVPGEAFEWPYYIRIAYSNSLDNIKKGIDRMEEALEKLQ